MSKLLVAYKGQSSRTGVKYENNEDDDDQVCVCVRARACVRVCVRARVRVCLCMGGWCSPRNTGERSSLGCWTRDSRVVSSIPTPGMVPF